MHSICYVVAGDDVYSKGCPFFSFSRRECSEDAFSVFFFFPALFIVVEESDQDRGICRMVAVNLKEGIRGWNIFK